MNFQPFLLLKQGKHFFSQIIDFKGHMRDRFDEFGQRAIGFITHPFDAVGVGVVAGEVELVLLKIGLSLVRHLRRDAEMMIASHGGVFF